MGLLGSLGGAVAFAVGGEDGIKETIAGHPPWGVAVTFATLFVIGLALGLWTAARHNEAERVTVGESRRRLTRAEGALEEVLRQGAQPTHNAFVQISTTPLTLGEGARVAPEDASALRHAALGLPELWEATHARLGLYHDIATGQAKRSFGNAQAAMWTGFALLVLFVVLALAASTTAGAVVAGGLGAVSAALSGFVSKTFVRSQEASATHLRSYFDQPLELSRYLAAERLVADGDLSQEQRGEILSALVQAMVTAPPQASAPPSVVVASVPGQQGV